MIKKNCTKCKKVKLYKDFYINKRAKDTLSSWCKTCCQLYRQGDSNILTKIKNDPKPEDVSWYHFSRITSRVKNKVAYRTKGIKCLINRSEFYDFVKKNWSVYIKLNKQWANNNFKFKFSPTIDRIDSLKHYSLDNIRFLALSENVRNAQTGRKWTDEYKRKMLKARKKNLKKH